MGLNDRSLSEFKDMPKPDKELLKKMNNTMLTDEKSYNVSKQEENIAGKTYIYKTIISKLRSQEKNVLPVASSGISATFLPNGRTAHSRFKIPIGFHQDSMCNISHSSMLAELLKQTDLIIWDEAPMCHRFAFEPLDKSLHDVLSETDPDAAAKTFGGKTVLLGRDFRQILLVIPQETRQETVKATINRSYLWNYCSVFILERNMKLHQAEKDFARWLLRVGDGTTPKPLKHRNSNDKTSKLQIDQKLLLENDEDSEEHIVKTIYSDFHAFFKDKDYLIEHAILTPRNETMDKVIDYMLSCLEGEAKKYFSSDSIADDNEEVANQHILYPTEFLNTMKFSSIPNHQLNLKINAPIMLLRNLNQREGLCNGTRLIVTRKGIRIIEAKILTGGQVGKRFLFLIPRIILTPTDAR